MKFRRKKAPVPPKVRAFRVSIFVVGFVYLLLTTETVQAFGTVIEAARGFIEAVQHIDTHSPKNQSVG